MKPIPRKMKFYQVWRLGCGWWFRATNKEGTECTFGFGPYLSEQGARTDAETFRLKPLMQEVAK